MTNEEKISELAEIVSRLISLVGDFKETASYQDFLNELQEKLEMLK